MNSNTLRSNRTVALATCLAIVLAACSDEESSQPGATGTGTGSGGDGTVTVNFTIIGLDGNAIEDVEVCQDDASVPNCQMSDAAGVVLLDLPADVELTIRMHKTGHLMRITPFETVSVLHAMYYPVLVTEAGAADFAQAFGVTIDDSKGIAAFSMLAHAAPGVTATLSPPSGEGPFYFDSTLTPLPQATEIPPGGGALFINVDPGTPTIGFAPAATGCAFFGEAWGTDPNATPVPVEANTHTGVMDLDCR